MAEPEKSKTPWADYMKENWRDEYGCTRGCFTPKFNRAHPECPLHGESDISGDRAAVAQEKEQ